MKASRVILPRASFGTIVGAVAVTAILCSDLRGAPRPRFTLTNLGTLPGGYDTLPEKVNNQGVVVGTTHTSDGLRVPFIYHAGVMTQIPGGGLNVNDQGATVGGQYLYHNGVLTDLRPALGVDYVAASGINNFGQIVGWAFPINGRNTAFLLSGSGVQFLPFLPGPAYLNTAYEVNDAGQAAGDCSFLTAPGEPARARAVLYENGQAIDLGTLPGGTYSLARAINASGHVVGWSGLHYGGPHVLTASHAFLYRDGQMIDLGALPGDHSSYGYDLNSKDWVVGASEGFSKTDGEISRAFLSANGKLHDLNDLVKGNSDMRLSGATGINDRGQIVGYSFQNHVIRGFLLTPYKD